MKMMTESEEVSKIVEALSRCGINVDWEKKRLTMGMMTVYLHSDSNVIRLLALLQRILECRQA